MDGGLTVEQGTIYDFLALMFSNAATVEAPFGVKIPLQIRVALRRLHQRNPVRLARRNVAHHYDIDGRIYELFLDRDRQYSCAYFEAPDRSLEDAQHAKKRHLASKLAIEPGMQVLDIGSGWGGLALYLAEACGAEVVGVTLSKEQHALSVQRAAQGGLSGRAEFRLLDYRDVGGTFDRVVSVGMFEHVGIGHYASSSPSCAACSPPTEWRSSIRSAVPTGRMRRAPGPRNTSSPAATSRRFRDRAGDREVRPLSHRYRGAAPPLRPDAARMAAPLADHRDTARRLMDERFCRMWEFYLASSECAFRWSGMNNVQIQMCRHQHALPITRDYIQREESRLRGQDAGRPRLKSVRGE